MGWIDDLVNTMTKAKTAVNDAVQPTVDTIHNSPLASFLKGNVNEGFSKIGTNLSNEGKTLMAGTDAGIKRLHGQAPTSQDLASEQSGQHMLLGGVLGTIGGVREPEAPAANVESQAVRPEIQPKPVRVSGGDVPPPVGKVAPEQLNKVRVPSNVYGGETDARIQQTLQNDVPGNSVQEKYANLGPTMKNMGDQITQGLKNDPKTVSIGDMDNYIVNNAKGWLRTQDMTPEQAISSMSTYTKQLYRDIAPGPQQNPVGVAGSYVPESGGSATMKGPLNISTPPPQYAYDNQAHTFIPDNMPQPGKFAESVSTADINKMRLLNNQDYGAVYQKMQNGSPLTTRDISIKLAHDTFKDVLGDLHPDLSVLISKQHDLFTLADEAKLGNLAAKEGLPPPEPPWYQKGAAGTALKLGGAAAGIGVGAKELGVPGLVGAGVAAGAQALSGVPNEIAGAFGYAPKSQAQQPEQQKQGQNSHATSITQGVNPDNSFSVSSIPQSVGDVKLNADGSVNVANPTQIKDATGKVIALDQNDANKQIQALQDDISKQHKIAAADPYTPGTQTSTSQTIAADNAQLDSLKTLSSSSAPLNEAYIHVNTITGKTATALRTLNTTAPNLSNLSGQINDLQNSLDPAYAGLKQQLVGIQKEIQGGNLDVKTKAALDSVLRTINQQNVFDYYQAIQGFVGARTSSSMAPTAQGVPAFPVQSGPSPAPSAPQDFGSIVGGSLPPFDQQFPGQTNPGLQ